MFIHFGPRNHRLPYFFDANRINSVCEFRYLGIIVNESLDFGPHVWRVCVESYRLINIFFRIFSSRSVSIYIKLHKVYILPILLYDSPVYSPYLLSFLNKLERVQRYFTRRLLKRAGHTVIPDYAGRLKLLGLVSISTAFVQFGLITLYKIINSQLPVPSVCLRFSSHVPRRLLLYRVAVMLPVNTLSIELPLFGIAYLPPRLLLPFTPFAHFCLPKVSFHLSNRGLKGTCELCTRVP